MSSRIQVFSLAGPKGDGKKPYLNAQGAFVGFEVPLLEQNHFGSWRVRPQADLERLFSIGYGVALDLSPQMEGFARIAEALNKGERALAAITLVQMGLPDLPDPVLAKRMAAADALCKAGYNPLEPRDDHNQKWVAGGASLASTRAKVKNSHIWLWPKDVHSGNEHECVSLVRAVIPGMPHSGGWRQGEPLTPENAKSIPIGTAIATFRNGVYNNTRQDHAAIYLGVSQQNGQDGISVLEQWNARIGTAHEGFYPWVKHPHKHFWGLEFSTID